MTNGTFFPSQVFIPGVLGTFLSYQCSFVGTPKGKKKVYLPLINLEGTDYLLVEFLIKKTFYLKPQTLNTASRTTAINTPYNFLFFLFQAGDILVKQELSEPLPGPFWNISSRLLLRRENIFYEQMNEILDSVCKLQSFVTTLLLVRTHSSRSQLQRLVAQPLLPKQPRTC